MCAGALVCTHIRVFERKWVWQGLKGNTCAPGHIWPLLFPPILPPWLLLLLFVSLLLASPHCLAYKVSQRPLSVPTCWCPALPLGALLPIPSQKLISSPAHYLFASFVVKLHHSLTLEVYFLWDTVCAVLQALWERCAKEVIHVWLMLWNNCLYSSDSVGWMRSCKQHLNRLRNAEEKKSLSYIISWAVGFFFCVCVKGTVHFVQ